jgi:hypothetical protein
MSVAVPVIVGMVVGVVMWVSVHRHIVRVCGTQVQPVAQRLVGNMTTTYREFVDATMIHCHHQKWHRRTGK